jgi:DnaK suppressor protein
MVTVPSNISPRKRTLHESRYAGIFPAKTYRVERCHHQGCDSTLQDLQDEGSLREPDIADRAPLKQRSRWNFGPGIANESLSARSMKLLRGFERETTAIAKKRATPSASKRLEARPVAPLTIEAQERHERMERTHRDDRE